MKMARVSVVLLLLGSLNIAQAEGWGTIKGRVVWGKDDLPAVTNLSITKDNMHCEAKGPLVDESIVVDAKSKGIRNVVVYLKKPSAIHPSLAKTAEDVGKKFLTDFEEVTKEKFDADKLVTLFGDDSKRDALIFQLRKRGIPIIDQKHCVYVPHALTVREGQKTLIFNFEPIPHNVKVSGFSGKNDMNPNMPPKTAIVADFVAEPQPLTIQCGQHPWMTMNAMVFDHPYHVVTAEDGSFELKNVPAGEVNIVMRTPRYIDPVKGGKGTAKGAMIAVEDGQTKDLGEVKYSGDN